LDARYTPGPWEVLEAWDVIPATEPDIEMVGPCYIAHTSGRYIPSDEQRANARLIAAAPDLFVSLKEAMATIQDYLNYEHSGDPWEEDSRAMGEMDINEYKRDGRMERAMMALAKAKVV
jgi:hypothetical protein